MDVYLIDEYAAQLQAEKLGFTMASVYVDPGTLKNNPSANPNSFHFPVNPIDEIVINGERRYKTSDIIGFGQADIHKSGQNIQEISFKTLFPSVYDESFCVAQIPDTPMNLCKKFEKWRDQENPLRLIITDINIDILVNISKFEYTVKAGEGTDAYVNITFRQQRDTPIQTMESSNTSNQQLGSRGTGTSIYKKGDVVQAKADICVYESNSTTSKYLGKIKKGTKITIYAQYGRWLSVYWGQHGGYIAISTVTK